MATSNRTWGTTDLGGTIGTLRAGMDLRVAWWDAPPGGPGGPGRAGAGAGGRSGSDAVGPGTIVLVQGRTEFIELYAETIARLQRMGFAVIAYDHRGQGGSRRKVRGGGHVSSYRHYEADLCAVVRHAAEVGLPRPFHILAHSMGGLVALGAARALAGEVERMVLLAPLLQIARLPLPERLLGVIANAARLLGLGTVSVAPRSTVRRPFETNLLTRDRERYETYVALAEANPDLLTGPPTIGWVAATLSATRRARAVAGQPLPIPALFIASGADQVVATAPIVRFARDTPGAGLVMLPSARHAALLETNVVRAMTFAALGAFLVGIERRLPSAPAARGRAPTFLPASVSAPASAVDGASDRSSGGQPEPGGAHGDRQRTADTAAVALHAAATPPAEVLPATGDPVERPVAQRRSADETLGSERLRRRFERRRELKLGADTAALASAHGASLARGSAGGEDEGGAIALPDGRAPQTVAGEASARSAMSAFASDADPFGDGASGASAYDTAEGSRGVLPAAASGGRSARTRLARVLQGRAKAAARSEPGRLSETAEGERDATSNTAGGTHGHTRRRSEAGAVSEPPSADAATAADAELDAAQAPTAVHGVDLPRAEPSGLVDDASTPAVPPLPAEPQDAPPPSGDADRASCAPDIATGPEELGRNGGTYAHHAVRLEAEPAAAAVHRPPSLEGPDAARIGTAAEESAPPFDGLEGSSALPATGRGSSSRVDWLASPPAEASSTDADVVRAEIFAEWVPAIGTAAEPDEPGGATQDVRAAPTMSQPMPTDALAVPPSLAPEERRTQHDTQDTLPEPPAPPPTEQASPRVSDRLRLPERRTPQRPARRLRGPKPRRGR